MTHTSTEQPEALRLAEMYDFGDPAAHGNSWKSAVCTELLRLHARVQELEVSKARVPLTLPQITDVVESVDFQTWGWLERLVRAVERAHGIE